MYKLGVKLDYYKGIVEEKFLANSKNEFEKYGIVLSYNDKTGILIASLDNIVGQISIVLNKETLQFFTSGIVALGTYDLFKEFIKELWRGTKKKKVTNY